jgi:hypothetical protein
MSPVKIVSGIAAVALLLALAPWPYGYYLMLRVVVCGAGIFCGVMLWKSSDRGRALTIALFVTALLFNTFIPAHLTRAIWSVLNVAGTILFGYVAIKEKS